MPSAPERVRPGQDWMNSGLPGRREWGASRAVFKQTLKKLVLLLKLLDRTIEIVNFSLEQLNPLGQVRHAGGNLLWSFQPAGERPADRRVDENPDDRNHQRHEQNNTEEHHGTSLRGMRGAFKGARIPGDHFLFELLEQLRTVAGEEGRHRQQTFLG